MKHLILIILALILNGCYSNKKTESKVATTESKTTIISEPKKNKKDIPKINYQVAIDFLNSYIKNNNSIEIVKWAKVSSLTSESFKKELENTMVKAWKEDSELGLGFDPIFDAQDFPNEGFELYEVGPEKGYFILKGIEWDSFKLTVKVITQNGKKLVDGCGIINIPEDKRTKR